MSWCNPVNKWPRGLAGAVAATIVALPVCAPAAFAAGTEVNWSAKTINFAAYSANNVSSYAEGGTTYMPVWYVLQALKQSGYTYTFNGKVLNITPPDMVTADTTGLAVGSGNLSIEINGQRVKQLQTEVRRDGTNGNLTQFIPIYYIQQILSALSFYNVWDGTTWSGQPVTANLEGNTAVRQGEMDAFVLDLTDANGHVFVPSGTVTWSVNPLGEASIDQNTGLFTASSPGTYEVTASVNGFHLTKQVEVYASAVGVSLSSSAASLMADGVATQTIAVRAVDAQGNTVQDFMGQVTLSIPTVGGTFADGTTSGIYSQVVVPLYNGVGTATLTAPDYYPSSSESVTSSALISSSDTLPASPSYGSVNVSYVTPVVTTIRITPETDNLVAGSGNVANLDVKLIDAAGNPVGSGAVSPVYVTFTVSGAASFASGETVTSVSEYVYPGSDTTIPVYAVAGQQGPITVSASGAGVSGSATFN